ncbi:mitochondrial carrier superfamily protein [Cyclospora cayetanensis]|uniref:Mitochondrial carrier superfamily protein n=1 Tax=Cyclospora cayetanensis TaxID=88456 RepID=A0A1D3D7U6_9EIME|nr:mitochondrial carrier superfamily protein [Cyclospora cayetanensis]
MSAKKLPSFKKGNPLFHASVAAIVCALLGVYCAIGEGVFLLQPPFCVTSRLLILPAHLPVSMLRHEGAASLYRGFLPTILGIVPYASVSFFTFETLKQRFLERGEEFTTLHSVVCGGFAGALGQTLTYPLDSVRKLMQANAFLHKYSEKGALCDRRLTTLDAFRQIYRRGGVRGLYKGASLCWGVPHHGLSLKN